MEDLLLDYDFVFFEIAGGKLRYWRTYFDTSRSAQVVEKTVGFFTIEPASFLKRD